MCSVQPKGEYKMTMQTMKPSETLIAARELISVPERWTQGEYARDENRNFCEPFESQATCFCSIGALWKIAGSLRDAEEADYFVRREMGNTIVDFNDSH